MSERDQQVFWLNGLAGTGKSTISQTFADMCFADGRLGASFFCSRNFEDRRNLRRIFPTLAFQLACQYPGFRNELLQVLGTSPDIGQESLCSQMEKIIVGPLKTTGIPTLIIIDALDECEDEEPASAILSVLSRYVDQIPDVKFFITGRPEPRIRSGFRLPALRPITEVLKLQDIERSLVDIDIQLFLTTHLTEIAKHPVYRDLPKEWPSPSDIAILCEKAAGLFIYASTVVRFASSQHQPSKKLTLLTSLPQNIAHDGAFSIDHLYSEVLTQAFCNVDFDNLGSDDQEVYHRSKSVVGAVLLMFNPLPIGALSSLLRVSSIPTTLRSLRSLLLVPNGETDPIRVFHKSISDFLTDPGRCKDTRFFINPSVHHREILLSCLDLMKDRLKENICGLDDYASLEKVKDLPTRRKTRIGDALEYACRFWTRHLVKTPGSGCEAKEVRKAIDEFFTTRLLFWIEVLIVMGSLDVSLHAVNDVRQWYISVSCGLFVRQSPCSRIVQAGLFCKWTDDTRRFILEYTDVIRDSPSEIYHYALPFSPSSSWLRDCYSAELSREVKVVKGLRAEWWACSRTVSLDSHPEALACREDLIAVGFQSGHITLLDAITGIRTSVLPGHTNLVRSLAFSSDGTFLVSGSNDKTIKLWDIQTGGVVKTIGGHTGRVFSVSISSDGATIASGSKGCTLRLWDIRTGECRRVMSPGYCWTPGSDGTPNSVSFSPTNSRLLISAFNDNVRRWDVDGCLFIPVYKGSGVAFSLDGTRFVSWGGRVATVRNSDSGVSVAELRVPGERFGCCRFSPDGKLIAGFVFHTVYIWDITGWRPRLIETLVGYGMHIISIEFSSSLILLSADGSIKFWQIGTPSIDSVETDSESTLPSASVKSINSQVNEGIAPSGSMAEVVKGWAAWFGLCKTSVRTPAQYVVPADVQLVNHELINGWRTGWEICLWSNKEGGHPHTVEGPRPYEINDFKISGDGSKVFLLCDKRIQARSICTGEVEGEVRFEGGAVCRFHATEGSRIWVRYGYSGIRGWDFGSAFRPPVSTSNLAPPRCDLDFIDHTRDQDTEPSRIEDTVTGEEVFRLSGRYRKPLVARWDGRYLVAGYRSGEVLILDFDHMIPSTVPY
jgi:WD40 repeat protein